MPILGPDGEPFDPEYDLADDPTIPTCPECGSGRVAHCLNLDAEGEPESAWFLCANCGHQWSDITLSEELLGIVKTDQEKGGGCA